MLYSGQEDFVKPSWLSVKSNAKAIAQLWKDRGGLNIVLWEWNPMKAEDVAQMLTRIAQTHSGEEILIDVSSTTKTVIVVASLLSLIYGLKAYYVPGREGRFSILKRTERMVDFFFNDLANLAKVESLFREHGKIEEKMEKLHKMLRTGLAEATFELMAHSRGAYQNEMVPFPLRAVTKFKPIDKRIISIISDVGGKVDSITELNMMLASRGEKKPFTTVNSRVTILEELGLLRTGGDRERSVELTEIGKGVSAGMKVENQNVE